MLSVSLNEPKPESLVRSSRRELPPEMPPEGPLRWSEFRLDDIAVSTLRLIGAPLIERSCIGLEDKCKKGRTL